MELERRSRVLEPGNGLKNWIDQLPRSLGRRPAPELPEPDLRVQGRRVRSVPWDGLNRLVDDKTSLTRRTMRTSCSSRSTAVTRGPDGIPGGQLLTEQHVGGGCPATPGQYDIIGYAAMKLEAVYRKGDPGVSGASGTCPNNTMLGPAGLWNYGTRRDRPAEHAGGCIVRRTICPRLGHERRDLLRKWREPAAVQAMLADGSAPPCDYVWDSVTHTVHWFNAATRNGADTYEIDLRLDPAGQSAGSRRRATTRAIASSCCPLT